MPVTIHDVARRAQVSASTVSRALSASDMVRGSTRDRVLAAAKELGYQPNPAARSLITGRTGNIGIVVPDLNNPFYTGVLRGVQARARQSGYAVFFADGEEDPVAEEALVRTMARQVDGVVMCAPFGSDAQLRSLAAVTSLTLLNRRLRDIPAALMDSAGGMRQVIDHLGALGHRRCAYLNGPNTAWSNRERRRGMRTTAARAGMSIVEFGPFEPKFEGGVQAADLALADGVTAIVAYNDLMALGVLSRLADRGVAVPQEMSVVGFDNLLYAAVCAPPLTTVAMPMEAGGRAAVDLLLAGIDGADDGNGLYRELTTNLIVRATTGAVRPSSTVPVTASNPTASTPTASAPTASTPAGSNPIASTSTASNPGSSKPASSIPASSIHASSIHTGSTNTCSANTGSTSAGSTSAGSTSAGSAPPHQRPPAPIPPFDPISPTAYP